MFTGVNVELSGYGKYAVGGGCMLEFGKYKNTPFVAIKCDRCSKWIIEQYWVRFAICPFCGKVNRIAEEDVKKMDKWLRGDDL